MTWSESWERRDPFEVYARRQARERRKAENSKEARAERARQELEALFARDTHEAKHRNSAG